ncbi:tetratricopeptide repeat protein [Winogradskyella jejuensis]|uniref:Tetratricopeptide repeat-containing protein n=1 Tax=Winogradskyella jejuensis TaxID=1089305 RepID=A0A1M5NTY0_9FLAO|nr:tetratricopeptide repeat protein [Winogradskyella jejuensis]SHG92639.1 Tetratricopeptide repeat-containing protein [Winogradskyella jejuensis]
MKEENYIAFDNYLSQSLSQEDLFAFEEKLSTDEDFKEAFETYRELSGFLERSLDDGHASKEFETNLKSISQNYFEKEKKQTQPTKASRTFRISQLAIAASVAVFLGLFIFNTFSGPDYYDYSNHDAISLTVRGNTEDVVSKAQNAFNNRDFEAAENYFTQILKTNTENIEVKLYKAISQIEQDKFNEADAMLSEIASGQSAYKYEAVWYAALSKLKQNDDEACLLLLREISEDADTYKKAQKLINKLD